MKVGKARRAVSSVLVSILFAGLSAGSSQTALANETGDVVIAVDTWNRDVNTGSVSYDVTMSWYGAGDPGAPCEGYCVWSLEARYIDGTVDLFQQSIGVGDIYTTGTSTATKSFTGTSNKEITHLSAVLRPMDSASGRATYTDLVTVSVPYPEGDVDFTVNTWDRNIETGAVSYDLTMSWRGAGQVKGPCEGYCSWSVVALHVDSAGNERQQKWIGGGEIYTTGTWTATPTNFTGTSDREITHVRATLAPMDSSTGRKTYTKTVPVSEPYPDGDIEISVNEWQLDSATGKVAYNFDVDFFGARQVGGPCDGMCYLYVEGIRGDGSVYTFYSTDWYTNYWSASLNFTHPGSYGAAPVDQLRARLEPSTTIRERYFAERYVGENMINDVDLMGYEASLGAALAASPSIFCDVLLAAGGLLPSTDGDSLPDAYQRCIEVANAASPTIRKLLVAVGTAGGAQVAWDLLLEEHAKEEDKDVPTEGEQTNPPLPWQPTESDEPNGCEQDFVTIAESDREHVLDRHSWKAGQGASEFYDWVNWEWLAQVYALKERALPSGQNCVRWVTYIRTIGVDRDINAPTEVYSVVTRPDGSLVTTHPGYATIYPQ